MENRITGKSPQPITDTEEVAFENNLPAQELCEQVGLLTAEVREALLQQALTVSNEKCNNLLSQQNALIDAASEQRKIERERDRMESERRQRENAERLATEQQQSVGESESDDSANNGSSDADTSRSKYSYGKDD